MIRTPAVLRIATLAISTLLVTAACGGDSGSVDTGGLTGDPIKVAVIGDVTSSAGFSWSGIPKVIEQAARQVNEDGGIDGRPIELVECDLQNLPDQAVACSRKAVGEKVAVALVQVIAGGQKIPPIMEQGKTAYMPAATTDLKDLNSDVAFPMTTNVVMTIGAGYLAGQHCEKPVVVGVQNPAFDSIKELSTLGLSAAGKPPAKIVTVPVGATDWAPTVAQINSENPDCIVPFMSETLVQALYPALIQSGWKTDDTRLIGHFGATYSPLIAEEFPELLEGGIFSNSSYPYTDEKWADFQKIADGLEGQKLTNLSGSYTRGSYLNFKAFVDVAKRVAEDGDEVNNETILAKFRSTTDIDTDGLLPPVDTSKPFDDKYARMFNRSVIFEEFKDGKLTPMDGGDFTDLTDMIAKHLN